MRRNPSLIAVSAVAALFAVAGRAEERTPISVLDLGLVSTAGNTEVTTFNLTEKVTHTMDPWKLEGLFAVVYGKTAGDTTASDWKARGRGDYMVNDQMSIYGLMGWQRNRFAGIERRFDEGVGVAYKVIDAKPSHLTAEAGLGLNQQKSTADVTDNFLSARLAGLYRHDIGDKAYFSQMVEALPNLSDGDDLRINSESALIAPLSDWVSLSIGLVVKYDGLPEPGFKKTDRIITTGLRFTY